MTAASVPHVGMCMKPARTARMKSSQACIRPRIRYRSDGSTRAWRYTLSALGPPHGVTRSFSGDGRQGTVDRRSRRSIQPAHQLFGQVGDPLGPVGRVGGECVTGQPIAQRFQTAAKCRRAMSSVGPASSTGTAGA